MNYNAKATVAKQMKFKATEKNEGTYLMRGDEVEDDGNGVLWSMLLFFFSVCLRVTGFFVLSIFSLVFRSEFFLCSFNLSVFSLCEFFSFSPSLDPLCSPSLVLPLSSGFFILLYVSPSPLCFPLFFFFFFCLSFSWFFRLLLSQLPPVNLFFRSSPMSPSLFCDSASPSLLFFFSQSSCSSPQFFLLFPQPSLPLFLLSACMASPFVHLLCSIFIGKRTPCTS